MSVPLSLLICLSVVHLSMGDQPVEEAVTAKKVGLLGDWSEVHPDSNELKEAVEYAVKMFNTESKNKRVFKLVSVSHPKSQVTNKINYRFDALLAKTKCLKSENHDLDSCTLKKRHVKCHFKVTLDPRTGKRDVQKLKCKKITLPL